MKECGGMEQRKEREERLMLMVVCEFNRVISAIQDYFPLVRGLLLLPFLSDLRLLLHDKCVAVCTCFCSKLDTEIFILKLPPVRFLP